MGCLKLQYYPQMQVFRTRERERSHEENCAQWFLTIDPHAESYYPMSPYAAMGNNPIRNIDPDGRDIVVLNNPSGANSAGANFGHMAILIGNDGAGWTYISKNGRADGNEFTGGTSIVDYRGEENNKKFPTLEDFYNSELGPIYTQSVRFATSTDQDGRAIRAAKTSAESRYHFLFSSCADAVSAGLKAAGLDPGYASPIPNIRFSFIKTNNSSSIFINLPEVTVTGSKSKNSVQNSNKSFDERMQDMLWQSVSPNSFGNTGRYNQPGRSMDDFYSDEFLKWYYDK